MAIDLLGLEPTKISRDLKEKSVLIYGKPKTGKTSFAVQFPNSLLLAFEKGYNALAGIYTYDIPSWITFKNILRELKKPAVKERYDNIIIDTGSIAWDRCAEYICQQEGVKDLTDVTWGKATKSCAKEFERALREITLLGYGLVILAHAEEKVPFGGKENETYTSPMLEKRPYRIINGMVDIIACIDGNEEENERFLQLRSNKKMVAGSRFKHMPDRIPLDFDTLVNALAEAIEKEGNSLKGKFIVDKRIDLSQEQVRNFDEVMEEARQVWMDILNKNDSDTVIEQMETIIENNFGQRIKLSTVTKQQQPLLELTILDLKDLMSEFDKK